MDESSGKIYRLEEHGLTEADAKKHGLVPIEPQDEAKVRSMNRHERRAWAARERKQKVDDRPLTERPLAAKGLTSYRCRNRFGWTMIGAKDDEDALREACRSWEGSKVEDLEVWNGTGYEKVQERKRKADAR